ncbi:mitochondrial carrier [Rozella allomycis CSF55]|uniref:Mitochondrial carrier n=1 Tax=Rozella allomycis (strain CSF55) TaxID=988480 RepID=A0A075AQF8_ROZAC|nr:Mitochondrial substrate/solute carrier domain-containing protein [Rozella allomycis CSF55]RKP21890.1 mitochondrial carrier [Rozella allomycis CSF55]|eukprot:EPZ30832.1 Mitochondrial substrate/solute carrier domain-containing protein [Rozella allomycis CSF55]
MHATVYRKDGDIPVNKKKKDSNKNPPHLGIVTIAGALGGMLGATITCPIEVSSLHKSADFAGGKKPRSFVLAARSIRNIYLNEGFGACYKGLGANLMGVIPAKGINFWAYNSVKRSLSEFNNGIENTYVHLAAGFIAGCATATITNPLWVIKTRMQVQKPINGILPYSGNWDCFVKILRYEGIRGFTRGLTASYVGSIEGTLNWAFYEHSKKLKVPYVDNSMGYVIFAKAALCKTAATLLSYPHEVIRTRLREGTTGGVLRYTGFIQSTKLIFKEEGILAFYRGLTTHLLRTVPNSAIVFVVYEAIINHFSR